MAAKEKNINNGTGEKLKKRLRKEKMATKIKQNCYNGHMVNNNNIYINYLKYEQSEREREGCPPYREGCPLSEYQLLPN